MSVRPPVEFDEEYQEFTRWVREFAAKYRDSYLQYSKQDEFPWDMAEDLGKVGLLGMGTSTEFGGAGRIGEEITHVHLGIMQEELSYANFYLCHITYSCSIMGTLLEEHLHASDRETWISEIVSGKRIVAMGVTEPGSGGDAAGARTRAVKTDGGWLINGEKTSITFAPHAQGIVVLARAIVDGEDAGFTAFLVPMKEKGVSQQQFRDAGWHPLGRSGVFFDDVFVPDEHVLGPVGGGFKIVLRKFDYARAVIGLMTTGTGRRALEMAIEYAKIRQAFGQNISHFEGVSFPIAEDYTQLEAARWLSYRALSLADLGKPFGQEAAMAKYLGVESSLQSIRDAIVTHGHNGFSEELPLQAMLRDMGGMQLGEGTPQIQKVVIARGLFGRGYV